MLEFFITGKNKASRTSVLFTFTVLLMAATAQAQQTKVQANVPFDFVVDDRAYTAGDYSLKSTSASGVPILIDNTQEAETGIVLSNACVSSSPSAKTKLVFLMRYSGPGFTC